MPEWWEGPPAERYWCEVTERDDIGADLLRRIGLPES